VCRRRWITADVCLFACCIRPPTEETMIGRLDRSLRLLRESWAVLMAEKDLLVFPICSRLCSLLPGLSFVLPWLLVDFRRAIEHGSAGRRPGQCESCRRAEGEGRVARWE